MLYRSLLDLASGNALLQDVVKRGMRILITYSQWSYFPLIAIAGGYTDPVQVITYGDGVDIKIPKKQVIFRTLLDVL